MMSESPQGQSNTFGRFSDQGRRILLLAQAAVQRSVIDLLQASADPDALAGAGETK